MHKQKVATTLLLTTVPVMAEIITDKPVEAWLPEVCWRGLSPSMQPVGQDADRDPSSILLPHGQKGSTGHARTVEYTDLTQLQTLSRCVLSWWYCTDRLIECLSGWSCASTL